MRKNLTEEQLKAYYPTVKKTKEPAETRPESYSVDHDKVRVRRIIEDYHEDRDIDKQMAAIWDIDYE